jgi:hypothetical protein
MVDVNKEFGYKDFDQFCLQNPEVNMYIKKLPGEVIEIVIQIFNILNDEMTLLKAIYSRNHT